MQITAKVDPGAPARPLGLYAATALVVGNMIGSGTFLLPASLAPYGLGSLPGWALTFAGALLLALVFARLALAAPQANGGPHAYVRAAFGAGPGFIVAWCYWISCWCGLAAIAIAFVGNLGALWAPANASPAHAAATAALAIVLCTGFNLAGLRTAGIVQSLTAALKLLPLLLLGLFGWFWFDPAVARADPAAAAAAPGAGLGWAATASVAALTLWAFLGLECATVPAAGVREPQRTIPRATLLGTLLAGLASMLACTVVLGLLPAAVLVDSSAPLVDAARATWGAAAGTTMALAATIACFGAVNGWVLVQGQVAAAAAQDGLFPRWLAPPAGAVPVRALLLSSALALLLVLANYDTSLARVFGFAILLSTAAALLPFLFCAAALWRLDSLAGRRSALRSLVPLLAGIYAAWALWGTGTEALLWGAVLVAAAGPAWLLRGRPARS